ncbi:sialic acid TRAP transporter substrate-binding protein SiaP [Psychromarinibacter sp. C21-152]|uniref:Sialic acid TRAP transporter substrate-binding protein SiaP n=1 Tax=Psychromarinibacter sediminicola TaxID=3033385 RepID=A0AAE3NRX4_9RHOB|nr:sialic acid TRAP transporter substrate-binding protein SiaP [Psychromarinibacter sediminicola]MDF0599835.1 sialic acid TRAP transporter substrate-binding protein SiaP [Psychromarinibacter sediminicola]
MKHFALGGVLAIGLAMPVLAQDQITLRLGMQGTEGDPQHQGVVEAARVLEESSDGRITLEIFPNSQLGNFTEMMEQLKLGELDFTLNPFGGMNPWVERAIVADTPYVAQDFEHLQAMIASDWGQSIQDELRSEHGLLIIDDWYFGTRHTTSNAAIESAADFDGMRLRVPNSAPLLSWARAMGASPTPVAFAEVYLALQTNQVDGQENPLPTIDSMGFMEVQSHLALTGHLVQDQAIIASAATWDTLSEEDKALVTAAFEAGGDVNDRVVREREASLIADFEAEGATVTEPDRAALSELMASVYADLDERFGDGTVASLTGLAGD